MGEEHQVVLAARLPLIGVPRLEMDPVLELGRADELLRQIAENRPVEKRGLELRVAARQAKCPGTGVAPHVQQAGIRAELDVEDLGEAHHQGVCAVVERAGECQVHPVDGVRWERGRTPAHRVPEPLPDAKEGIAHEANEIDVGPGGSLHEVCV